MKIRYEVNPGASLNPIHVFELLKDSGLSKPNWSIARIEQMIKGSSIVVAAFDEERLIGFANAITDFAWIGYISQVSVHPDFQKLKVGTQLVETLMKEAGNCVSLVVHSADAATDFYRANGFTEYSTVFRRERTQ